MPAKGVNTKNPVGAKAPLQEFPATAQNLQETAGLFAGGRLVSFPQAIGTMSFLAFGTLVAIR